MKKLLFSFMAIAVAALTLSSCVFNAVTPEGEYTSKSYELPTFENIYVSSGMELILTQDSTVSVKVETYENIHEYINVEVVDNTLRLSKDLEVSFRNAEIKVYVNIASLDEIEASSGSHLNLTAGWVAEELDIDMSSGSSAQGNIEIKEFSLKMSSGSDATFSGKAEKFTLGSSSGSTLNAFDLEAINCSADLSSGSYAEVFATGCLYAESSSGASIKYKGTSQIEVKTGSGGSVNRAE